MRSRGKAVNVFIFYFTMMLIHHGFQLSPYMANVATITRTKRNKIDNRPIFSRYLREENLILLTGLKKTLKPNHERILEILKQMEEYKGKMIGLRQGLE